MPNFSEKQKSERKKTVRSNDWTEDEVELLHKYALEFMEPGLLKSGDLISIPDSLAEKVYNKLWEVNGIKKSPDYKSTAAKLRKLYNDPQKGGERAKIRKAERESLEMDPEHIEKQRLKGILRSRARRAKLKNL